MFDSVLIANRGEIACRVIRSARALGMRVITVHSEADREALFVRQGDSSICIGPAPAAESYLRIDRIIEAAKVSGAQCIHPGYGFLSERPELADACAAAGVTLIGPPAAAMRAMGLKDAAKALVHKAGVPVVPGYHGDNQDAAFLKQQADALGYPVLIKAVSGGGGKGMRRIDAPDDFLAGLASAQREGASSFGDPRVLVEKYVLAPRHIEIQVFADGHGNVAHLFERDCSLQRRHQKVIEEAPAPGMTVAMRDAMGVAAVNAARAVGYVGAGTVEFIADGREGLRPDRFWFMEMNTRLQVEHPVTEAITGIDLVKLQFEVAAGARLPFTQQDLKIDGHAVEARLYAEDPETGFLPSTGRIWLLDLPEGDGVRVDSGVEAGGEVSPWYDPMIAKIIAHGATRDEALDRLARALGETRVAGPRANTAFLKRLAESAEFRAGQFDTGFIDTHMEALGVGEAGAPLRRADPSVIAAGVLALQSQHDGQARTSPHTWADPKAWPDPKTWPDPWSSLVTDRPAFQLLGARTVRQHVVADGDRVVTTTNWGANGVSVEVAGQAVEPAANGEAHARDIRAKEGDVTRFANGAVAVRAGGQQLVVADGRQVTVSIFDPFTVDLDQADGAAGGVVKSPMHGKIIAVLVAPGEDVIKGQRLALVEAMKMEHPLTAPRAGVIADVRVEVGQQVAEGAAVIVMGD